MALWLLYSVQWEKKNHVAEYMWLNTIILQKVLLNKHAYIDYVCFVHK